MWSLFLGLCLYSRCNIYATSCNVWNRFDHLRSNLVPKSLNHILPSREYTLFPKVLLSRWFSFSRDRICFKSLEDSPFELWKQLSSLSPHFFTTSFQLQPVRIVPLTRCKAHLLVVVRPMLQPSKTTASWQQFQLGVLCWALVVSACDKGSCRSRTWAMNNWNISFWVLEQPRGKAMWHFVYEFYALSKVWIVEDKSLVRKISETKICSHKPECWGPWHYSPTTSGDNQEEHGRLGKTLGKEKVAQNQRKQNRRNPKMNRTSPNKTSQSVSHISVVTSKNVASNHLRKKFAEGFGTLEIWKNIEEGLDDPG